MEKVSFISVNVRGLNTDEKRKKIYSWLYEKKIDIALLQETHFVQKYECKYNTGWKGKTFHAYSDSVFSRGVTILFRENLDIKVMNFKKSLDGRKMLLNVDINGEIFSIINVYAPNILNNRHIFFTKLKSFIEKNCLNDNIILCGDFNCQINDTSDKSLHVLKNIMNKFNLIDFWKSEFPELNGLTWCDAENNPKSRIDYVLLNENIYRKFGGLIIRKIPGTHSKGNRMSDHRFLKFHLNLSCEKRGPGYWKLNVSNIENDKYKKEIHKIIDNLDNSLNPVDKWECIKRKIKEFSINFSKYQQRSIKKRKKEIKKEIENIGTSKTEEFDYIKAETVRSRIRFYL